jgi:hypothetical protein
VDELALRGANWRAPDELWVVIAPILAAVDPPKVTGRPRVDPRVTLEAIIFGLGQLVEIA